MELIRHPNMVDQREIMLQTFVSEVVQRIIDLPRSRIRRDFLIAQNN